MKRSSPARAGLFVALILCSPLLPAAAQPSLVFSPEEWKFGMIIQGEKVQTILAVTNLADRRVTVTLVPTCACMSAEPRQRTIAPGAQGTFLLRYDSSDDTGITRKDFIVHTDLLGWETSYYTLRGTVRAERVEASSTKNGWAWNGKASGSGKATVTLSYYYTPGCRSCERFLSTEIPRLEKELGITIAALRRDILDPAIYEELASFASSRGEGIRAIPALRAGNVLLQGDAEIGEKLEGALRAEAAGAAPAEQLSGAKGAATPVADRLAVFPVIAAGLIDGINPCAFTTLIFLLASLALAGRGRREVLIIGALFSLAVFLSYLAIGLGFFAALRAAAAVSIVAVLLRWALVLVLAAFASMSLYDYLLIRRGRPTEILLQLPSALKRRIHSAIRTRVRTAALAGSSLLLGFLVSVFEFACTGQVYLPLLAYIARVRRGVTAVVLLVLYNLCFIAPLLVVFAASYLGVSSGRITAFFQAHMGKVKLGLALVFVGLAVFTLVG